MARGSMARGNMERRTFMKSAAGTMAAPAMAFAAGGRVLGANDRIRVAVLGVNGRGKSHIRGFEPQKNVEIVALVDPDIQIAEKRAGEFEQTYGPAGWEAVADFAEEMLESVRKSEEE